MIIDRVFTPGLAQVAYLIGDEQSGELAVIDPRRDIEEYLNWATAHKLRITAVLETHVHADFVSGALELAEATGATLYASRLGEQTFPHTPVDDGNEVRIGDLTLRSLWTPGHTPEHLAYLLIDPTQGHDPVALFSGDALFVGEVGRPDLLGEEQTQRLAGQLYHTVMDRLRPLDDKVVVYPGHTAGSACGKKIGDAPQTTMGQEKRFNYAFQTRSKDAFVRMVLAEMPPPPTYYPVLKQVNKHGAPFRRDLGEVDSLTPSQMEAKQASGALVIDVRSPQSFGTGHIPGAFFAGLGANFSAWMGWLAPYDHDLILVVDEDAQVEDAKLELHRIGIDRIGGFLAGGMAAWRDEERDVAVLPQISVQTLAQRLKGERNGLVVLDVRSDDEWNDGHIAGAVHRFAGEIVQGEDAPVNPGDSEVAVICGSGYRSSVAASVLLARGYRNLINVVGGMTAWNQESLPKTTESPSSD